jgi:uncharacterized protein YjbJ (UPF0337 family)
MPTPALPEKQEHYAMNQDILAGKWKQAIGKAKETWGKLTDDELVRVEGHSERLAGLLQEKYGQSKEEAEKSANAFFNKHK